MSYAWFSIDAISLRQCYGVGVEDPSGEGRYRLQEIIPNWEEIGIAVQRLFNLSGPALQGADSQGEPDREAIDEAVRQLSEDDANIVRSWIRTAPEASTCFTEDKEWTVDNGRHRLNGIWTMHPDWQLPIKWNKPDPDSEPAEIANSVFKEARKVLDDIDAFTLQLNSNSVNDAFRSKLSVWANLPDRVPIIDPVNFKWEGLEPERFSDVYETIRVFAWSAERELLVVVDSRVGIDQDHVHDRVLCIAGHEKNHRLMELITDARKITIIGLVDDLDTQSWQMDQVEEVVAGRNLPESDGVSEFMFGSAVTWFSTLP